MTKIDPSAVHVWLLNLELLESDGRDWKNNLSADEIDRGKSYKFERDRQLFFKRRGILRQLLAKYTAMHPREIIYGASPTGKLSLPSHAPSFNISTCQERVVFAFTAQADVGVDLEQVRPLEELSQLIDLCFSEEEMEAYFALDPAEKLDAFYHVWTQKEAFLKARGDGLTTGMKEVSVSVTPNEPCGLRNISSKDRSMWKMVCDMPEPGWRLAVCAGMANEPVIQYHVPGFNEFLPID